MYNVNVQSGFAGDIYPEREEPRIKKPDQWAAEIGGVFASLLRPRVARFSRIVEAVESHASGVKGIGEQKTMEVARELGRRLRTEGYTEDLVARSFALVREVSERTLGMRHMDVQLVGGLVLLNGMVAEMETGEGKTLTATLPACTLALGGVPVHIITVNDYLAQRDSAWMGPVYSALGLTVGTVVHGVDPAARRKAYRCDITYCTNKEVAFDYLRDRIVLWDRPTQVRLRLERLYGERSRTSKLVMRGLHFAIVDEADSVLIDEARTPLIICSESDGILSQDAYRRAIAAARDFIAGKDFKVSMNDRTVELLTRGKNRVASAEWPDTGESLNLRQREELVRQALVALYLFDRDKHYLVNDGKVQIVDEYTGRLMADRSWERGLHQLIEIKEDCEFTRLKETRARISYQRFFRRYLALAGMTGTAREVASELWSVYRLRVVSVPTSRPMRRRFLPDRVYADAQEKWESIVKAVGDKHRDGRPVLVGTRSVEASEHLSRLLKEAGLPHTILNARQDEQEAEIIAQAGKRGQITVATNMAGRGTDIRLEPQVVENGGLHVIASERHESRRIDRQLFGRSGRQGDPGSCEAVVSLEDELITVYVGRLLRWLAALSLKASGGFLSRWPGRVVFGWAQRAAERQHARARRDLLKFDEQISDSLAFTGKLE